MFLLLKPNSNNIKSINHDSHNNSYASIKMLFTLSWASDCNKILPCPTSSAVYLSGTIVLVVQAGWKYTKHIFCFSNHAIY